MWSWKSKIIASNNRIYLVHCLYLYEGISTVLHTACGLKKNMNRVAYHFRHVFWYLWWWWFRCCLDSYTYPGYSTTIQFSGNPQCYFEDFHFLLQFQSQSFLWFQLHSLLWWHWFRSRAPQPCFVQCLVQRMCSFPVLPGVSLRNRKRWTWLLHWPWPVSSTCPAETCTYSWKWHIWTRYSSTVSPLKIDKQSEIKTEQNKL